MTLPTPTMVGSIRWYGEYSVEQRIPDASGAAPWVLYKREHTGIKLIHDAHKAPELIAARNEYVYHVPKNLVTDMGTHPINDDATLFEYVWLPIFEGTLEAVEQRLEKELG